ncbi:MAG: hypothetical protein ACRCXA_14515 [Peptostreptococcaceae bacterium]
MKPINTQGITYLENLEGTTKWYWGTDYIHGDLFEAEELFNNNHKIKSNTLLFVSYPDGKVIEPIKAQDGQYFGRPIYYNNNIIILLVDFNKQLIKLEQYDDITSEIVNIVSIPLSEVKDCYNLMQNTSPLMLTRQGHENSFEIIYPNKMQFQIGNNESFYFRKDDHLYFSAWFEDEEYREEVIIRDINTGDIIEKKAGTITVMPDGQVWLLS